MSREKAGVRGHAQLSRLLPRHSHAEGPIIPAGPDCEPLESYIPPTWHFYHTTALNIMNRSSLNTNYNICIIFTGECLEIGSRSHLIHKESRDHVVIPVWVCHDCYLPVLRASFFTRSTLYLVPNMYRPKKCVSEYRDSTSCAPHIYRFRPMKQTWRTIFLRIFLWLSYIQWSGRDFCPETLIGHSSDGEQIGVYISIYMNGKSIISTSREFNEYCA